MPPPATPDALIQHIQSLYNQLSPQFQRAARYLIDHPAQVSTLSARKLALQAEVQPATLVRLAQHLGYPGWETLKAVFTRDLQHNPNSYTARAQSLLERPDPGEASWHTASTQQARNIASLESANHQAMQRAVAHLVKAKRIAIAGFRSSYPPAFSLCYLCGLFRPNVHLLHNTGGTMSLDLHHLQPEDTVIVISYAPYSREILAVAKTARQRGCTLLALCDSQVAPIALLADHILIASVQGPSFFPSTVALQSLIEMLAQQWLVHSGGSAITALSQAEAQLHATGAYL